MDNKLNSKKVSKIFADLYLHLKSLNPVAFKLFKTIAGIICTYYTVQVIMLVFEKNYGGGMEAFRLPYLVFGIIDNAAVSFLILIAGILLIDYNFKKLEK